jgi:hypothetical protein
VVAPDSTMAIVAVTRVNKHGSSYCITLNKAIRDLFTWRPGDKLSARRVGEVLVFERIPLEQLSKLRPEGVTEVK